MATTTTRIKDIPTTATTTASDDYFVIDGATNGTRKYAHNSDAAAHLYSNLHSLFPLPVMRTVASVANMNLAGATKPADTTIAITADASAYGGKVVTITLPANLTNAKVIIPLLADARGAFPKALPKVEFHISSPDYTAMPRLYAWLCEDAAATKGRLWIVRNEANSTSVVGLYGPYLDKWTNVIRPVSCTPYANVSNIGNPAAWGSSAPLYEAKSIAFTVNTGSAGATLVLNRVCCQEWKRGAIIIQMDGGYSSSYTPIYKALSDNGARGVVSRLLTESAEYMTDAQFAEVARAGWDVCQHISDADATPMGAGTTSDGLLAELQKWRAFADSIGIGSPGYRTFSTLTNSGPTGFDGAGVLRSVGILGGRGKMPDETFGVDTGSALTDNLQLSVPYPGGWSPRRGRFNRYYADAGDGVDATARNTYQGSGAESLVNRCAAGKELGWLYIHRTMDNPTPGNIGPAFAQSFVADIIARMGALSLVPITATQADDLTYSREGDVYLDYLGMWRSRSTGKIAI